MSPEEREPEQETKPPTRERLLKTGTVDVIHIGGRRMRIAEPEQSILAHAARLKEKSGDKGQGTDADKDKGA